MLINNWMYKKIKRKRVVKYDSVITNEIMNLLGKWVGHNYTK